MNKSTPFYYLFLAMLLLASCSDMSVNPETEEIELAEDPISGTWEMSGVLIHTQFCWLTCTEDSVPEKDTTNITFEIELQWDEANEDSVRIIGLPNANKGENTVFSEHFDSQEPQVYARISGLDIEIDLDNHQGNSYIGTGTINENSLTLNSVFHYRARKNEYTLEGVKLTE